MGEDLKSGLAEDALAMVVGDGLLHHSDLGTQYTSDAYQGRLGELRACVGMSGVGNCCDNAVMESFFGTPKAECATDRFASGKKARHRIFEFIEILYNRRRPHSSLGFLSTTEYEHRLSSDMIGIH